MYNARVMDALFQKLHVTMQGCIRSNILMRELNKEANTKGFLHIILFIQVDPLVRTL